MHKKETLTVDLKSAAQPMPLLKESSKFASTPGTRSVEDYSKTYADNEGYGGPSHAYGMQDLNYYGDFFYANGYGYVWQPYGFSNSMIGLGPI